MQNIHPVLIHFPIALLFVGLFCDIAGRILRRESLVSTGWWCQVFGIIGIIGATVTGLLAEGTVGHNDISHSLMTAHQNLELAATGLVLVQFIWRSINKSRLPQTLLPTFSYFAVGVTGVGLMLYGAHLGGRLVYDYGVGGTAVQIEEPGHSHADGGAHSHQNSGGHSQEDGSQSHSTEQTAVPAMEKQTNTHVHQDGQVHTH